MHGRDIYHIMHKITVAVYLSCGNFILEIISGRMSDKQEEYFIKKFDAYKLTDGRYHISGYYAVFRDEIISALNEFGFTVDPIFWDDLD